MINNNHDDNDNNNNNNNNDDDDDSDDGIGDNNDKTTTKTAIRVTEKYKMAEVTSTYKHGIYKRVWLKNLHAMSNVKVFATPDSWPPSQTNTTDYIDPYVTHTDQN